MTSAKVCPLWRGRRLSLALELNHKRFPRFLIHNVVLGLGFKTAADDLSRSGAGLVTGQSRNLPRCFSGGKIQEIPGAPFSKLSFLPLFLPVFPDVALACRF